jgi:hypothetical protein
MSFLHNSHIKGSAQCCPALIHILLSAKYSAISWECIQETIKLKTHILEVLSIEPINFTSLSFENFSKVYKTNFFSFSSIILYHHIFSIYSNDFNILTAQDKFGVHGSNLSGNDAGLKQD